MNDPLEVHYFGALDRQSLLDLRRRLMGTVAVIDRVIVAMSLTPDERGLTTKPIRGNSTT